MRMTVETVGIRLFVRLSVSVGQVGSSDNTPPVSPVPATSAALWNLGAIPRAVDHLYCHRFKKNEEKLFKNV